MGVDELVEHGARAPAHAARAARARVLSGAACAGLDGRPDLALRDALAVTDDHGPRLMASKMKITVVFVYDERS